MVNHPLNNLFLHGDTERQIQIAFNGGIITNKEIHQGSFELSESLCSEQHLVFGSCEASVLKFKVHNFVTSLKGKKLTVSEILEGNTGNPFFYGKYKVEIDKPTADRKYRDIVAYDAMYDILNADVASWYNGLTFPCSIRYFRNKFLQYLDVDYVETELVNDDIYIDKTIDVEELSGKTVINAICEINGCFGHINRQGKFEYIVLDKNYPGLLPRHTLYPKNTLYPSSSNEKEKFKKSNYISCEYEDFETKKITGLQIRQSENDISYVVGTPSNLYTIQDNFLVYGKDTEQLTEIAENVLEVMSVVYYRPIDNLKTSGKPYLEVGDRIAVVTNETIIHTYVLERTIKAVKGQKDTFYARGTETYGKELNGLSNTIVNLKRNISLKASKKTLISEINICPEEIKIQSDKIKLEGYTTINDGFSIDEEGTVTIAYGSGDGIIDYWCQVGEYGLNTYRIDSDVYSGIRDDGLFLYDYEYNGFQIVWCPPQSNYQDIYIGDSNVDKTYYLFGDYLEIGTSGTINGYEIIHEGNIEDYATGITQEDLDNGINVYSIDPTDAVFSSIRMPYGDFDYLNVWESLSINGEEAFVLTEHSIDRNAMYDVNAYYYKTNCPYGDTDEDVDIPTIQWVINYVDYMLQYLS